MKKIFVLLPLVGILSYVVFSSNRLGPGFSGNGDRTGATSTVGCSTGSSCHNTTATTANTMTIQLFDATGTTLISPAVYTGGTSYILKMGALNGGTTILSHFGFQLATVKTGSTTTTAGTLTAIASTHVGTYGGIKVCEHSTALAATGSGGAPGGTYEVDIPWTAPTAGTGSVTAYGVINEVNNNLSADAGDLWNNTTLIITEATAAVSPITGTTSVCVTATTPLSDATPSGTWSTPNTTIATVGASSGIVTGVAAGTATISYTASSGTATTTVTVNTSTPAAITSASVVCVGLHIYCTDAIGGGVWSSPSTATATVSAAGVVVGAAPGTATISYTVTNSCGTGTVTKTVTVRSATGCVSGAGNVNPVNTELKVYPNPNYGVFTVDLQSENDLQADVVITNIMGETVKQFTTHTNRPAEIQINRPTGIYFITVRTIEGVYTSRVLLQ